MSDRTYIYTGKRIERLKPGDSKRTAFSAKIMNFLLDVANAMCNCQVVSGPRNQLLITESNAILSLVGLQGGAPGTGSGNMNYRGVYSGGADYAIADVVYTSPDANTRITWVAEIANGISTTVQAPTWPEPGTVYWRALDYFNASGIQELAFQSWGYGGSNDYITCSGLQVRLPPLLRFSQPSPRSAHGTSISYGTYNSANQSRVATIGGGNITQIVTPAYTVGDLVYAANIGGVLQDLNVDGRKFCGPST